MILLRYSGEKANYAVNFTRISKHVLQVKGDFPAKSKGFILYRMENPEDPWDYQEYKTVYREITGGVQFSDDGSVYVAPPEPKPTPEPEPYVPTLEEIKETKKQEIRIAYQAVKAAGVDIELSTGIEHFPLSEEEVTFLMGKQVELASGNGGNISYQDADSKCKFYSVEDMQKIIDEAFRFVSWQTTYRNTLWEWVDACETKEEVEAVAYGNDIPEQYQNDVFKSYLAQMEEETSEGN